MTNLPANPLVLDMGCGPGMQTRNLLERQPLTIIPGDLYCHFLRELKVGLSLSSGRTAVHPVQLSMFDPPFKPAAFDVVWSEGAIYIMGFQKGMECWRYLLKPGGCLAVTECSWLKPDPPQDLRQFWQEAYPAMLDIEGNLQQAQDSGFEEIDHFILPAGSWWQDYYNPLIRKLEGLKSKYHDNPVAMSVIETEVFEMELHRKYSDWYGYVFYILRKPVTG
jgi:SAM-dependent methyltransferase